MWSGSYLRGPVRAVEIPKKGGTRILGIPSVVDRVAQTVAVLALEPDLEKVFHDDSFGYRPGRSALDAVAVCREQCHLVKLGSDFRPHFHRATRRAFVEIAGN